MITNIKKLPEQKPYFLIRALIEATTKARWNWISQLEAVVSIPAKISKSATDIIRYLSACE